ncbi:MAG: DegT/DnrJ/EryC1/StrS family aminotransferase, partial [Gemmataceae bacterium]|nr:DegT/DnrJ/EryC1/StrS family aminotransferase [Gemmataceae bacterium]
MMAPDWPLPDEEVREAMLRAWADGSWGKYCAQHSERLGAAIRAMTGAKHVLLCASGTVAVEAALRAAGCGPGTEVVMAAYDYGGNFLSVHAAGAMPVLADVDEDNRLILEEVGAARAVVVSHLHGAVAAVPRLPVPVIEDSAQCPGQALRGDLGVWSFGGSKLLTAGRGGALLTSDDGLAQRARLWLGRGNNLVAPLSELQAAVLLPQVEKLAERNRLRREAVGLLRSLLPPGLRLFAAHPESGYYKVGMRLDEAAFGLPRARLVAQARAAGIALDVGFRALHVGRSPTRFRAMGDLAGAGRAHCGTLILHHPILLAG